MLTIRVREQFLGTDAGMSATARDWDLRLHTERITLRELIRRRTNEHGGDGEQALSAFSRNGFVVLVDDRQVTDPDEELLLARDTEVTFLKLMPLVGG